MVKVPTAVGTLILVAWIGGAGIAAQSGFDGEWPALLERLERAHITGDIQGLTDARAELRRWMAEPLAEREQQQVRYAIAYANWRLLAHPDLRDHDDRDDWGDEAVELLRENLEADDGDIESHALLGSVWGMQITSMWSAMRLGGRASEALDAAQALDGSNPRFLLLKGIDLFHRPERFGGGAERAEAWFRSAAGFFDAQPAGQPWPDWGRPDAYAWLGRTLERLGDEAAARKSYEQALAIEPDFSWVSDALLPRLNRE